MAYDTRVVMDTWPEGPEQDQWFGVGDATDDTTHRSHTLIENVPTYTTNEIDAFLGQEDFSGHDSDMSNPSGGSEINRFTKCEIKLEPEHCDTSTAILTDESVADDIDTASELHQTQCEYVIVKQEPVGGLPASNCFEIRLQSCTEYVVSNIATENTHTRGTGDTKAAYVHNRVYPMLVPDTAYATVDSGPDIGVCTYEQFEVTNTKSGCNAESVSRGREEECTIQDTTRASESPPHDVSLITIPSVPATLTQSPYTCDTCGYEALGERALHIHHVIHTAEVQKNDPSLTCRQCSYQCMDLSSLKQHMRKHSGNTSFRCEHCERVSATRRQLKDHLRMHNVDKLHKCTHCPYRAKRATHLKLHELIHSEEKTFACTQCTYTCRTSSNLTRHMKTHSNERPYKCPNCTYSCKTSGNLKTHIRIHTSEKPYKCTQCPYAATRAGTLKSHIRTHSKQKPYTCTHCTYTARQGSNLAVHMRTHHTDEASLSTHE